MLFRVEWGNEDDPFADLGDSESKAEEDPFANLGETRKTRGSFF